VLRDVPDDIRRTLRARAAAAGVSLSDYLRREVVRLAERPPIADVLQRAARRHGGVDGATILAEVRGGRDRA
jgi:hypothetical protein